MGLYDRVIAVAHCPFCGSAGTWHFQYKYGACRLNDHQIGDEIPWYENPRWDDPQPIPGRVRIAGLAEESCPTCGADEVWAAIIVEHNRIAGIEPLKHIPREGDNGVIEG